MLKDYIYELQTGDKSEFSHILEYFTSLINFLSKKVKLEDISNDLTLELFIICNKIDLNKFNSDKYIYSYIKRCLINYSNKLYHKYYIDKEIVNSEIYDVTTSSISNSIVDEYTIYFYDLIACLPIRYQRILTLKYVYQFTDKEIGYILHISRQAVNRIINTSINKLNNKLKLETI